MSPKIAVLAVGNELLDGRVADTNSQFIGRALGDNGLTLDAVGSCSDDVAHTVETLGFLAKRAQVIIVSGGLGPTTDDLTRESVAKFAGLPLVFSEPAWESMQRYFTARGRELEESNRSQAYLPEGAELIVNSVGTAPCFAIKVANIWIAALPGVPRELMFILNEAILPRLKVLFPNFRPLKSAALRTFGLPEAIVGAKVKALGLPPNISVSYRATFPEIETKLSSSAADPQRFLAKVEECLGPENVFTKNLPETLPEVTGRLLAERSLTVSLAESCTGGLVAKLLTDCPGSSQYFIGAAVTYANTIKENLLRVAKSTLNQHGAVSHAVAKDMAEGSRRLFGSDFALSISGIAGPDGGSVEKPAGTYFVGFADKSATLSYHCFYAGPREMVRMFAAYTALDILRRRILGLNVAHGFIKSQQ